MDTDLKIILDFLARCGVEVSARTISEPQSEDAKLLIQFATGQCRDAEERKAACALLKMHPAWMRWITDRVKAARPPEPERRDGTDHPDLLPHGVS